MKAAAAVFLFMAAGAWAHHPILGKFDESSPKTLEGVVTKVDWRNPHAHLFVNIQEDGETVNWAVELESPILLRQNGWEKDTVKAGDHIRVEGIEARNDTRQVWGETVTLTGVNREVFTVTEQRPAKPLSSRPVPRYPDGRPALGGSPDDPSGGYWSFPSKTTLYEEGADVEFTSDALLTDIENADEVAPMRPWALELYKFRQRRQLQDDPMYINCKPPGGPRQYQSDLGFQLIQDRDTERVFVLMGSGNRNYRLIYLDGRTLDEVGQVGGSADNPLYYGRSVGHWEGDTMVVTTSGFNEDFWFTNGGLPHTSELTLEERFTRVDQDTLRYEVTIDDPGAYTRPWTASWTLQWMGGKEMPDHWCQNNRP